MYSPTVIRTHLIRTSDTSRFVSVVFGRELIVKVWFEFIVLVFEVSSFFLWFS